MNEDVGDEEEDEVPQDEDNDGWLAAEDDLGIDDEDEETREVSSLHALVLIFCHTLSMFSHDIIFLVVIFS